MTDNPISVTKTLTLSRFNRKIENMCGISNWLAYPKLRKTGDDSDDVTPTSE